MTTQPEDTRRGLSCLHPVKAGRGRAAANSSKIARQLYEAADAVVQQGAAVQTYVEDIDQEPLMVRGIYAALDAAGGVSPADLLASAPQDSEAFLGFVNGSA